MFPFFPEKQFVGVLDNGAFTYHDWDELVLTDVPAEMKGLASNTLVNAFQGSVTIGTGSFNSSTAGIICNGYTSLPFSNRHIQQ